MKIKLPLTMTNVFSLIIISLLIAFQPCTLSAQSKFKLKRKAAKADNLFSFSEYNKALPLYLSLLETKPTDITYNFRTGICYLYSNIETFKSIAYLETALKNISSKADSMPEYFYYSGHAYHLANQFDKAINNLHLSISLIDKNDSLDTFFIEEEIAECQRGKKLILSPTKAKIFNLGENVNSIYPEYSPVIMPDNSLLIFTSKRKGATGGKLTPDGDYYEDIFISKNISDDWSCSKKIDSSCIKPNFWAALFSPAKSIGNSINTNEHDASVSLSPDGKKLFVYRFNAIWESEFSNGIWNKPKKLNEYINSKKSHESSVSLTLDNKTLYFISEREGGFGGKDIYKSLRQDDGTWGPAENLGSTINTEQDEEAPFVDFEDQTLYFSSQGHNSIGGYDIFKTKFENNEWSKPESLGYPVNSGADDIFFIFNDKRNKGYISSIRDYGIGNYDIYAVRYAKPANVILFTSYGNNLKPLDLKGTIVSSDEKDTIPFLLNKKNNLVYNNAGTFKLTIPEYNTNKLTTFEFTTPESFGDFPFYQEINYDEIKNYRGQFIGYKTTVFNTFFNIEKELEQVSKRDTLISKEQEYSAFTRTLKPDYANFQIFSQTNYIDTSSFATIAAEKAALAAKQAKEAALAAEFEKEKTQKAATIAVAKAIAARKKADATKKESAIKAAEEAEAAAIIAQAKASEAAEIANAANAAAGIASTQTAETTPATKPSSVFASILFDFSKSTFSNESKNELEKVLAFLNQNKNASLEIIGHTDSEGSVKYNLKLSKRRSAVIKKYLVKNGINPSRLKSIGMGESQPVAPNKNADRSDNPESRKQNRRVEFKIIEEK